MPKLAVSVDALDAVEEAYRPLYVEKGGKFVLDADIEDTAGIKAKNAELIGKNKQLSARAAIIGDRTPEDIQADLELAAKFKEDKAKAEGNFDALKTQLIAQHNAEILKERTGKQRYESKLYDVMAKREVEAAITAAGGNAKVLLPHVLPFVKVTEQDDDFVAQVVDAKGNPRIADGQATPMTIAQLVEMFKADDVFKGNFAGSGASGGGASASGARSTGAEVLIPKDASVQEYRRMKDDAEKRGVPYRIAS